MLRGVDISNLQGPPEVYRDTPWYKEAEFVIVQAITPPRPYRGWEVGGYTEAQLRAAVADGKKVGIYVYVWNTLRAGVEQDIRERLSLIPEDLRLDIRPLVDVEDEATDIPTRVKAMVLAREVVDDWARVRNYPPSGGYSRDQFIQVYLGGYWPADWVYWQARLDGVLPPETELLPMRPMIQWTSHPVDQSIMLDSELITPPEEDVLIPEEYVLKFNLRNAHDVQGLIDNYEGVINTVRTQVEADEADCLATVQRIRVALTPAN